jgi:Ca2+-binding EF-hand superfamily protein
MSGAKYDPEMVESFTSAFHDFDKDEDGCLNAREFELFMNHVGMGSVTTRVFSAVDSDRDKRISLDDFLSFGQALWDIRKKKDVSRYLKMVFDGCDRGRKGVLTQKQFVKFMNCLGMGFDTTNPGKLFRQWDLEKKGAVSFSDVMEKVSFVMEAMAPLIK